METYELAFSIILVSVGAGLLASVAFPANGHGTETDTGNTPEEVHEHALFHVIVNGSEVDFRKDRFQLNARDVHLENNKSDIVHKHQSEVTWNRFLNTINTTYWRSNATGNLCLKVYNSERCGDGEIYLNGEKNQSLGQEMFQDDHLIIVLDTENPEQVVEEYMTQQLPPAYRPQSTRGQQV